MKTTLFSLIVALVLISSLSSASSKQRIGVYDSRILAVWYSNSEEFKETQLKLKESYLKAKEDKDTAKMKAIAERGPLTQRILHDKAFGRGSMAEVMEKRKSELESLAKSENLVLILSKWELNYSSADFEIVDVTLKLLELLKANEKIVKMYEQIKVQKPIEDAFFLDPKK